jgi:hypothetical protein
MVKVKFSIFISQRIGGLFTKQHLKRIKCPFSKGMFLMWPNLARLPSKRTYSKGIFYMVKISKISSAFQVCYF